MFVVYFDQQMGVMPWVQNKILHYFVFFGYVSSFLPDFDAKKERNGAKKGKKHKKR